MPRVRLPFATQSYVSRSRPLSVQRLVNVYVEQLPPDAKSPVALLSAPGRVEFATLPGAIRGHAEILGRLCVVAGSSYCRVDRDGTVLVVGDIPGDGPVDIAVNTAQAGFMSGGKLFVADLGTNEVVEAGIDRAISSFCALDGYGIYTIAGTGEWGITALNDFTEADPLDFATAEARPDPLVRAVADHRELWLLGTRTVEIWDNVGNADFPFVRRAGGVIERGCLSRNSVAQADNGLFWLGDDRIVYRALGQQTVRISTHAIEREIDLCGEAGQAMGWAYVQEGHTFYGLDLPGRGTFVYDVATQLWAEREAFGQVGWPVTHAMDTHGFPLVGGPDGKLYRLDLDTYTDAGGVFRRSAVSGPVYADGANVFHSRLEIEFEAGVGLNDGQGSAPVAMLRYSDDGGQTWSSERTAPLGRIGQYRTRGAVWNRLGLARNRVYEVAVTDPVKFSIAAAMLDIEQGTA